MTEQPTGDHVPAHLPVLTKEVCDLLLAHSPELIVDCTIGLGGHARLLLERSPGLHLIGLDLDEGNLGLARANFGGFGSRARLFKGSFGDLGSVLAGAGVTKVGGILADLGLSSNQLEDPARGFSFDLEGPLDMRLDRDQGMTAAELLKGLTEAELADLLYFQSQERRSRRISRRICQALRQGGLNSTVALARLVASAVGQDPDSRRGRIHPATRTFMALRICVNRELESLRGLLEQAPRWLEPQGRIAVISFHSGEDRMVKEDFRARAAEGVYRRVTKKPVTADKTELRRNPRSRSAKLRVAEVVGGP